MRSSHIFMASIAAVVLTVVSLLMKQTVNAGDTSQLACTTIGCEQQEDRRGWPFAVFIRPTPIIPDDAMKYSFLPANLVLDIIIYLAIAYAILKLWYYRHALFGAFITQFNK